MLIKVNKAFDFTTDRGHTIIKGNPDDATKGVYEVPAEIGANLIKKNMAVLFEGDTPDVKPVKAETAEAPPETDGDWKGNATAGITDSEPEPEPEIGEDELDIEETGNVETAETETETETETVEENADEITEEDTPDIKASLDSVIAECKGKDDAIAKGLLDDWAMKNAGGHIDKRKSVDNICETLKELVSDNNEG